MARIKIHPSITPDRVMDAVEAHMTSLANPGFCLNCGSDADGCEPDMRRGRCELCGENQVYGAEEVLMML